MDDVFSLEKDEEIPLVLEEEPLCCFESNLVGEESLSIPKLCGTHEEENIQRVATAESKQAKIAGRSNKRNSDDLSSYNECKKCNEKCKSYVFFKKHVIKCGKQGN